MDQLESLSLTAHLGEEARAFMDGKVGLGLLAKADALVREAVFDFSVVDTSDRAKVDALQLKIRQGLTFGDWLTELVQAGDEAIAIYQQTKET